MITTDANRNALLDRIKDQHDIIERQNELIESLMSLVQTLLSEQRDLARCAVVISLSSDDEPEPHGSRDTFVPHPDGPDAEQFNAMQD